MNRTHQTAQRRAKIYRPLWLILIAALAGSLITWASQTTADAAMSPVLNIYSWEDYIGRSTIETFEEEFGVQVNLLTCDDEAMMFAEGQSDPAKHDVMVASGGLIREMTTLRLLATLGLGNIPNIENLNPKFRSMVFDPDNQHSVPYLWGTTGIIVNREIVTENVDWSVLADPKYQGKIAMLNSADEVIGAALKHLGYSIGSMDPKELEAAEQWLQQQPLVAGYLDPITIRQGLIADDLWATHIYSGEGMYAVDENELLEYVIPRSGAAVPVDNLAIPRDSPHQRIAEQFINFVLRPQISAAIANDLWYANCNMAADVDTDPDILNSSALYPPAVIMAHLEPFHFSGEDDARRTGRQIRNRIWAELILSHSAAATHE